VTTTFCQHSAWLCCCERLLSLTISLLRIVHRFNESPLCALAQQTAMQTDGRTDTHFIACIFSILANYAMDVQKARFGLSMHCHVCNALSRMQCTVTYAMHCHVCNALSRMQCIVTYAMHCHVCNPESS
jgi:hypothetical protein